MTVIRPNSITGITSITAQANEINVFRHNGVLAGLQLNGVNHHTSAGVSTFHTVNVLGNLDVAGVLTYQDVTNVDSLGIGTFRTGINVSGGQLDVGSNIKLGNAGVVTATSFVGSGANLTGITQTTINSNTNNYLITGTGTANTLQGEANLTFDGTKLTVTSSSKDLLYLNSTHSNGPQVPFQTSGTTFAYIGSAISLFSTGSSTDLGIRAESSKHILFGIGGNEKLRIDSSGQFALGRTNQITGNGNSSTSVFEQLSNSNYPLALHSAQSNNRGLMIFYATTGNGNAGDPFIVCTDNTNNKFQVTSDGTITTRGNILPAVNNDKNLGSSSVRWANIYTNDLNLSNENSKNDVDGTWGNYTIQEGESDLFLINNRSGKKYKFNLTEVV